MSRKTVVDIGYYKKNKNKIKDNSRKKNNYLLGTYR